MDNQVEVTKQKKAYEHSFLIENILRVSMHNAMVERVGLAYFSEKVFPAYEYDSATGRRKINVVGKARGRRARERDYNLSLGYDYPFFWYLDFTELISLMDTFWDSYFEDIFKTPSKRMKDDLISRLNHVVPVRNAIAHHRYVSNVDLADLESLLKVLKASFDSTYLSNFEELALNSLEGFVQGFVDSCREILTLVGKSKVVDKSKLDSLKRSFGAVAAVAENTQAIEEFEEVVGLIVRYNKLPRKPGRGDDIASFKRETEIEKRLSLLSNAVEEYL